MSKLEENILSLADEIVNNRSEEKSRQYGPFGEGMERAAKIASGISGKNLTAHDMFIALISLKFSRQSYNFKKDNLLDAAAYIGAWQNYINETGEATPTEFSQEEPRIIREKKIPSRLVPPSNWDSSTSIDPKGK